MKSMYEKLGVTFQNHKLLETALTHKSFSYEQVEDKVKALHNEKLEFLGDAVLDLVLSEYLMETFPNLDEGPLSKMRAHLVNEAGLSQMAVSLELQDKIQLGKGEIQTAGSSKPRLLASCFEALMGALFADQGYDVTKKVVRKIFENKMKELQEEPDFDQDFKSQLQELIQAESRQTPVYEVKSSLGPAHDRTFEVSVSVGNDELAVGQGKSKKSAEQRAAMLALQKYSRRVSE